MKEDSTSLTMMRTLLLLNSTQRKLQYEEHITDSSSPLRALMLQHVAQSLNDHLHNEQSVQTRESNFRHSDLFARRVSTIAEEEVVDDEEDDQALLEMQNAIEVGQPPPAYETDIVIEIDELEDACCESLQEQATGSLQDGLSPNTKVLSVDEVSEYDEDQAEVDITESELDDMPSLSRQVSHSSIPSLYHSDGDEEDEDEHFEHVNEKDTAVHRFLLLHHGSVSHPATSLFDKRSCDGNLDRSLLSKLHSTGDGKSFQARLSA